MRSHLARASAVVVLAAGGCAELVGIDDWRTGADAPGGAGGAGSSTGGGDCAGVDCLGGDCVAGKCGPLLLSVGSDNMRHLAVDATDVYFTHGGSIVRVPTNATGTVGAKLVVDTDEDADFLALDEDGVYWTVFATGTGAVRKQSKSGPPVTDIALNEDYPIGLSVVGGAVYWLRYELGTLRKAPAIGGMVEDLGNTGFHPFLLATDGVGIWWSFKGPAAPPSGGVRKLGTPVVDVAQNQSGPTGLAVDTTSVYWLSDDSSVHTAPKLGGLIDEIGPPEAPVGTVFAGDVVADATHVYWTGLGPKIMRAAKADGRPEVFAEGDWGTVNGLAMGSGAVYWTTKDMRLFRQVTAPR